MLLCELNRIHSHLVFLGTSALELGAISMFWYCFRERETILDLFELVTGQRMHTRYFQVGGLAEDIPQGFYPECRKFVEWMPHALDDYKRHPRPEPDLARADAGDRRPLGAGRDRARARPARTCAPPASTGISAATSRTSTTTRSTSRCRSIRTATSTTATACGWTRWRSRTQIVRQCLDKLERMDGMPWIADDRKVVLPPREELHTSMESLIHHFKIVTEGFRVPAGEIYVAIESPRGESGCYLVSDGGPKPWRVHFRAPSFVALEATATCLHERARRRPDRRRRLARRRHGGHRPVSRSTRRCRRSARAIRRGRARRSLPALRLAQEKHGWLSREALEETADALERHAGLLLLGRDLLRHVPSRARRAAHDRDLHEPPVRALRRAEGRRGVRGGARDPAPARRRADGESRCARSSASAAAATRRSSPSTTATAITCRPETVPEIVEELAGARWLRRRSLGGRRRARPDEARGVPRDRRLRRRLERRAR